MAAETQRIRFGTLVSNPILRSPALLAQESLSHPSGGRLELGIGTGIASFDHATMGTDYLHASAPSDTASGAATTSACLA